MSRHLLAKESKAKFESLVMWCREQSTGDEDDDDFDDGGDDGGGICGDNHDMVLRAEQM